jgi:hypothetical protein
MAGSHTVSGAETVGLPWIVLLAFLRLNTRPGLFHKPLSVDAAFDVVDAWMQQPSVAVSEPAARHLQTIRDLIAPLGTGGNLTPDPVLRRWRLSTGPSLLNGQRLRAVQPVPLAQLSGWAAPTAPSRLTVERCFMQCKSVIVSDPS